MGFLLSSGLFCFVCSSDSPLSQFCFTHVLIQLDLNILLPLSVFTKTISPSTLMNLCGPSHFCVFSLYTSMGQPAGKALSFADASKPFRPEISFKLNANIRASCYVSTIEFAASTALALFSFLMVAYVRAGLDIAPKTHKIWKSPSGPIDAFTANTSIFKNPWELVLGSVSVRML